MSGAPAPDIKILEGTKPVMNDPDVVTAVADVLKAALGDKFRVSPPGTASEDFSEFAGAGVPSMMFNIGVYDRNVSTQHATAPARQYRPIIRRCLRRCRSRPSKPASLR